MSVELKAIALLEKALKEYHDNHEHTIDQAVYEEADSMVDSMYDVIDEVDLEEGEEEVEDDDPPWTTNEPGDDN